VTVSQFVIKEPSGSIGNESERLSVFHGRMDDEENARLIWTNELEVGLITLQKSFEVSGRKPCSDRSADVPVGVQ
jgi:hypothetical protein